MNGASLAVHPCQKRCCWRPTEQERAGEPLFSCTSCGSEWLPSQPWSPVDADGTRHPTLSAALDAATPT